MSALNDLLFGFTEHMKVKGYSPATKAHYRGHLQGFIAWLSKTGVTDLKRVTRDMLITWQASITQRPDYAIATICIKVRAVKRFFEYLESANHILINPAEYLKEPKKETRLPRVVLTKEEVLKILDQTNLSTLTGIRDRTILEVLYSSGVRKEEILNLLLTDVDYNDGFLRINAGKGNKDRVVPIGKIACRYLENYIKAVRPSLIRDPYNNYLFLSLRGNRLSKNMVWEIVKSCSRKAKIKKTVSPHTFRHTCATLMLRNNANIRHIQELLGHASLDSTQVYAQVSITDLKEVHSKCHPREKDRE